MTDVLKTVECTLMASKSVKHSGQLTVSASGLRWEPTNAASAQPVALAFSNINGSIQRAKGKPFVRIPAKQGPLVIEFASEEERDAVLEIVTSLVAEHGQSSQGQGSREVAALNTGPQADLKNKLLKEDRDLNALFDQLVKGGVISEAEFWRTRQHLLVLHKSSASQRKGMSSTLLHTTASGADGTVQFHITPEIVHQIFAERPHVQRAYMANVPHNMDDTEFWTRYYTAYFPSQGKNKRKRGEQSVEAATGREEMFTQYRDSGDLQDGWKARLQDVDPTVNLAADSFDVLGEGHGSRGFDKEPKNVPKEGEDVAHDLNQHGAVVLEGLPAVLPQQTSVAAASSEANRRAAKKRPAQDGQLRGDQSVWEERARSGLEDLKTPSGYDYSTLNIQRSQLRTHASPEQADDSLHAALFPELDGALAQLEANPAKTPQIRAWKVLQSLSAELASSSQRGGAHTAQLLPAMQQQLRLAVMTTHELLRHFWSCFPLVSPARKGKAVRLDSALERQYLTLKANATAVSGAESKLVASLVGPVMSSIEIVRAKYAAESR